MTHNQPLRWNKEGKLHSLTGRSNRTVRKFLRGDLNNRPWLIIDQFLFHVEIYTADSNPKELKQAQVALLRWVSNIFRWIFLWSDENFYFQGHHWIPRYQCISVLCFFNSFKNRSRGQTRSKRSNQVILKQGSRLVSKLFNPFSSESIVSYK